MSIINNIIALLHFVDWDYIASFLNCRKNALIKKPREQYVQNRFQVNCTDFQE